MAHVAFQQTFFLRLIIPMQNSKVNNIMYVRLRDYYDRKALRAINGMNTKTMDNVKKSHIDHRRKRVEKNPLKSKYVKPFKKARSRFEFDDHFSLDGCETKRSGRRWKTYSHDFRCYPTLKGKKRLTSEERLDVLFPIVDNRMDYEEKNTNYKYQWMFYTRDKKGKLDSKAPVSTKAYSNVKDANKELKEKMKLHCSTYLTKPIGKLDIVKRHTPTALVGQVGKSDSQAKEKWLEKSPNTKIHCGYASVQIAENGKFTKQYVEDMKNDYDSSILSGHVKDLRDRFKKWCVEKHRFNIPETHVDEATLKLLAIYKKRPIWVYDNLYALKWKFEGAPTARSTIKKYKELNIYNKPIEIRLKNQGATNHFHSLLRWKDINAHGYTREAQQEKERIRKEQKDGEDDIINTVVYPKPKNTKKLATWDIEASPRGKDGKFQAWAVGLAWLDDKGRQHYKKAYGLDCLSRLLDFLYNHRETFDGYYLYAHNGGAFDFSVLMNDCLLNHDKWRINTTNNSAIEQSGSWISAMLETKVGKQKFSITMRDSVRMLPETLDKITKELDVKHKKLPETVNHDDIADFLSTHNFNVDALLIQYPQIKQYLRHDCLGLLEVVESFSDVIYKATYKKGKKKIKVKKGYVYKPYEGGLDMVNLLTGATLAKKMFFLKYYNKYKQPLYKLSVKNDKFIRHSYLGGRTEVLYRCGKCDGKKWWSFDFTSLYPAMCVKHQLPCGKPETKNESNWNLYKTRSSEWTKQQKAEFADFFGFVQVRVRTLRSDIVPLHGIKHTGKLEFPIMDKWTYTTLFSEEMKLGLKENQYDYILGEGIEFQRGMILKDFMMDGFKKKAEAKSRNQSAMAQIWKIIINSGYGWFGLRTQDRDGIEIHELGSPRVLLDDEQVINEADYKNYTIIRKRKNLPIEDFNVGVASAVTAWARMRLWELIRAIHKLGGKVAYVDTDSVKTNIDVLNTPELQKEFMWDFTGDELGSLKNECNEEMEKAIKKAKAKGKVELARRLKADHDHHMKKEKGSLYFDSLITYQAKFYSVKKTLKSGHKLDMSKCKGHNGGNLNHENFKDDNGASFQNVKMKQFLKPKSGMVSESRPWGVCLKSIEKTFNRLRKYKWDRKYNKWVDNGFAYTKGRVDDRGYVSPNII